TTTPLPAELGATMAPPPARGGDGHAEEWLGAVASSLAPDPGTPPPAQRVRLRYRKVGPARFIGTRELGTVFLRAARRARLPLAFSQGHHPMPRRSFGPALPLGFSSDDEYVDVDLTETRAPAAVAEGLAAELPDGLEPRAASEVPRSAPSIDATVASFVYDIDLAALDTAPAPSAVADAVARFTAAATFPVAKRGRAGAKTVDARHFVRALAVTAPQRLSLEVAVGPEGTLKPEALLGPLLALPESALPALRVHKVATRFRDATPVSA